MISSSFEAVFHLTEPAGSSSMALLLADSPNQVGSSHGDVALSSSSSRGEIYQCEGSNDCDAEMTMRNGKFRGENMLYFCKLCTPSVPCCQECGMTLTDM